MDDFKENRVKVHEIVVGSVVIELYKKVNPINGKVYFDYSTGREFFLAGERKIGRFCQQRDLRDDVVALMEAMEWISSQHRNLRNSDDGE